MKIFLIASLEVLFALFVLSFNWHWAFILLCMVLIPWGVIWTVVGLIDAVNQTGENK